MDSFISMMTLQLWAFKCIQDIHFLTPKISLHPNYQAVSAAHQQSSLNKHLLHVVCHCLQCDMNGSTNETQCHSAMTLHFWQCQHADRNEQLQKHQFHSAIIVEIAAKASFVQHKSCSIHHALSVRPAQLQVAYVVFALLNLTSCCTAILELLLGNMQ